MEQSSVTHCLQSAFLLEIHCYSLIVSLEINSVKELWPRKDISEST